MPPLTRNVILARHSLPRMTLVIAPVDRRPTRPCRRASALIAAAAVALLDVPALAAALRSDAFYVGAIGSRRTQDGRRARLLEEGLSAQEIDRLAGPIGLDIGAETPEEIAVAIAAEILATRTGRDARRLKEARGRIHSHRH